jgi:hypothetical protein
MARAMMLARSAGKACNYAASQMIPPFGKTTHPPASAGGVADATNRSATDSTGLMNAKLNEGQAAQRGKVERKALPLLPR